MTRLWIVCALAIVGSLAAAGCNKPAPSRTDDNTVTTTAVADNAGAAMDGDKAKEVFKSRCAACHGAEGKGDGPGAAALNPKPRNYHDKDWQAKVTDEEITKAITYGGAAIGKSPMMPGNPDLDAHPETIAALVHIVRDFGK